MAVGSRAAVALLLLLLASAASAGIRHEILVEAVDRDGGQSADLSVSDLEIRAGPANLTVLEVTPVSDWNVAIVFDRLLSTTAILRGAARDLAGIGAELAALGRVELVVAAREARQTLSPTADGALLEQALTWMAVREQAVASQLEIRRRFVEDFELDRLAGLSNPAVAATAERRMSELAAGVREALAEETEAVSRHRRALLRWAVQNRPKSPSVLLLVTSGADESGLDFYRAALGAVGMEEALAGIGEVLPRPDVGEFARTMAALGWLTISYSPRTGIGSAQGVGETAADDGQVETVIQDGQIVDRTMLKQIDPRDLLRRRDNRKQALLEPRLLDPSAALRTLAEASGGDLASDPAALRAALLGLGGRRLVRVVEPEPQPEMRPLEVRYRGAGPRTELRSRRWLSSGVPPVAAEMRARAALESGLEEGALEVSAQLVPRTDGSRLVLEVEAVAEAVEGPLRLTLASYEGVDRVAFLHSLVDATEPAARPPDDPLRLEIDVDMRPTGTAPVVVVVEQLDGGRWGSAFPSIVTAGAEGALSGLLLATPRAVHLLEPEAGIVYGPTLLEVVYDPEVASVRYVLDGEEVASAVAPPFSVRLDLGPLPEPHRIEAVALDVAGSEIGRDEILINSSGASFRVRIVRPQPAAAAVDRKPLVGPIEVEASVESPRAIELDRLEFFWNDVLVATRFAPPFSQWISIPEEQPKGFIRVVGHLADGSTSEDVLFVNSPGASERVRVELVQLFVVVTDRSGTPLRGLGSNQFEVYEDDVRQELSTFSEAQEQPLTVGLAIDASASMFVKLPEVQKAAASFLRALDVTRDKAFVVDFGHEPRLEHDTSGDLEAVEAALLELEPEGRTAIWKGITFSLVQLQGVPGKKALIVFSDGADEDPDFSFRTCLKFARRVGVPVYVIVSNNEIHRTGGRGLNIRGFMQRLETLTGSVGGRVFLTRVGDDLGAIYEEIDEELRSQYLLGFYARDLGESRWRPVRVEVAQSGARVRTVAGYFR